MLRQGRVGEEITGAVLEASGLFDVSTVPGTNRANIGPIENNSKQGIDFIAQASSGKKFKGKFVGFEVKTGLLNRAPALSKDQRKGAQSFINSRLEWAANRQGHFQSAPLGTAEFAQLVQQTNRGKFSGFVVKIDNLANSQKRAVSILDFVNNASGKKGRR